MKLGYYDKRGAKLAIGAKRVQQKEVEIQFGKPVVRKYCDKTFLRVKHYKPAAKQQERMQLQKQMNTLRTETNDNWEYKS